MSKKPAKPAPAEPDTKKIWIATIAAVLLILGLAVTVSVITRGGPAPEASAPVAATQAPAPVVAQAPATTQRDAAPAQRPAVAATDIAPLTPIEPVRPPVRDTRPQVDLSRLAGTLAVATGALVTDNRLDLSHSCYRDGHSIPVNWQGAPRNTRSFVLVLEERRAGEVPVVKWIVYNIPADSRGLPPRMAQVESFEGGIKQGRNHHNTTGYTGPCVPQGKVDYQLRLFALDTVLAPQGTPKFEDLVPLMNGHVVDAATQDFIFYLRP